MCVVILCHTKSTIGIVLYVFFFFQAEDGIRDLVRSRGLGDVYKRQDKYNSCSFSNYNNYIFCCWYKYFDRMCKSKYSRSCLLYTSDAADERSSVDLGGRRIIKKKKKMHKMKTCLYLNEH